MTSKYQTAATPERLLAELREIKPELPETWHEAVQRRGSNYSNEDIDALSALRSQHYEETGKGREYTDDRTPAQREAYDQGQDDYDTDDVDDLRAMRCEFYAAGVRTAHYSTESLSY